VLSAQGKRRIGIIGIAALPGAKGFREQRAQMYVRPVIRELHVMARSLDHATDEPLPFVFEGEAGPLLRMVGDELASDAAGLLGAAIAAAVAW
jgi:hypothetical protein